MRIIPRLVHISFGVVLLHTLIYPLLTMLPFTTGQGQAQRVLAVALASEGSSVRGSSLTARQQTSPTITSAITATVSVSITPPISSTMSITPALPLSTSIPAAVVTPSISVTLLVTSPQISDDDSIFIARVSVPEAGWIVIRKDNDDAIGEVLLQERIEAGDDTDGLQIFFDERDQLTQDSFIWVILQRHKLGAPDTLTMADEFPRGPGYAGPLRVELIPATPTLTPTATFTPTATPTPSPTPNLTATVQFGVEATQTAVAATLTAEPTVPPTPTPTPTPTATATNTPLPTDIPQPGVTPPTPTATQAPDLTATEAAIADRVRATLTALPANTPDPQATATALAVSVLATAIAQPTPTPLPTPIPPPPTPTPDLAATQTAVIDNFIVALTAQATPSPTRLDVPQRLVVRDQTTNGQYVRIDQVEAAGPSWVVVYNRDQANKLVGRARVPAGTTQNLEIIFRENEVLNGANLRAVLHVDDGAIGKFEYPNFDQPAQSAGGEVAVDFTLVAPTLVAQDQAVSADNLVVIQQVFTTRNSFVALYDVQGQLVGKTGLISANYNGGVTIRLDATPQSANLTALLVEDQNQDGKFDFPNKDSVVLASDSLVRAGFNVILPPTPTPTQTPTPPPPATAATPPLTPTATATATVTPQVATPPTATFTPTPAVQGEMPPIERIDLAARCETDKAKLDTWGERVSLTWQLVPPVDMSQYPDYRLEIVAWPEGVNLQTSPEKGMVVLGDLTNEISKEIKPKWMADQKLLIEKANYLWGFFLVQINTKQRVKQLTPNCWFRVQEGL